MNNEILELKILILPGNRDGDHWMLLENNQILAEGYNYPTQAAWEIHQAVEKRLTATRPV